MNNNQQQSKKDIGGLWKKTSQSGSEYLSGSIEINKEKIKIVVFLNSYKKPGEKTPDYKIFLSEKRDESPEAFPQKNAGKPKPQQKQANPPVEVSVEDEDIPF